MLENCPEMETPSIIQDDQLNMAVFFSYLEKVICLLYTVQKSILNKSLFPMYQKNTAMFNWSPCIWHFFVSLVA